MYLTNKYYDNAEIGDCGGDHDGWILNTLLLCRVKSGAKQQKGGSNKQIQMWTKH